MKLQHLHVSHLKPGPVAHRHAVARLLAGGGRYLVHSGAATGGNHHHASAEDRQLTRANVEYGHSRDTALTVEHHVERARVRQLARTQAEHLVTQPAHDLDARLVAAMYGAAEVLRRERLLVDRAVGVAVEEAAHPCLQLVDNAGSVLNERPRQLLIVDVPAALERVGVVQIERVARVEHGIVAALHHDGATGPADDPLAHERDAQAGVPVESVEHAHKPGAAAADHRDVCLDRLYVHRQPAHPRSSFRRRRSAAIASPRSRPFGQYKFMWFSST